MNTRTAFLLRFLLPPLYAALGFMFFALLLEPTNLSDALPLLGTFALFAYIIAGLPALLFAIALARIEKRCEFPSNLANATLLGGLSGAAIGAITLNLVALTIFALVGLVIGFLVESTIVLLKRCALRAITT